LSETEPLGDDPSSEPSGTGDGGCGGETYNTLNLHSSTTCPASLLNYKNPNGRVSVISPNKQLKKIIKGNCNG